MSRTGHDVCNLYDNFLFQRSEAIQETNYSYLSLYLVFWPIKNKRCCANDSKLTNLLLKPVRRVMCNETWMFCNVYTDAVWVADMINFSASMTTWKCVLQYQVHPIMRRSYGEKGVWCQFVSYHNTKPNQEILHCDEGTTEITRNVNICSSNRPETSNYRQQVKIIAVAPTWNHLSIYIQSLRRTYQRDCCF